MIRCTFHMGSQAIHVEMTKNLETDSLILMLRRFIARRGNVRLTWCDNGGNFLGAKNKLAKCIKGTDHNKIREFLLKKKR